MVSPAEVEDRVPEVVDIAQAVRGLKVGIGVGLSGMREEELKGWLW